MVEGVKRGSPEVMYGEGKKEGRFPKVRIQEEVFFSGQLNPMRYKYGAVETS